MGVIAANSPEQSQSKSPSLFRRAMAEAGRSFCALRAGRRVIEWRIVLVFVAVNAIVAVNAARHDPRIGYDRRSHFAYVQALAELRLVTLDDTEEYFSPPLPYLLPALFVRAGAPLFGAARAGQWVNLGLSLGVTLFLLMTARTVSASPTLRLVAVAFLGSLPVYYRTFAFVRGEPYLVFFAMLAVYLVARVQRQDRWDLRLAAALGLCLGLVLLSRQSGLAWVLAVAALVAWRLRRSPEDRRRILGWLGLALCVMLLVAGWFYLHLWREAGTFLAFNKDSAPGLSLRNQPAEFYLGTGDGVLFKRPFRPSFEGQLLPIFYSEVWGDYWGYFSVYGRDLRTHTYLAGVELYNRVARGNDPAWLETNLGSMPEFLGRVNRVALYPTFLGIVGAIYGALLALGGIGRPSGTRGVRGFAGFLLLTLVLTAAGYLLALIFYPSLLRGDTIKATYLLHLAPSLALLVGLLGVWLERKNRWVLSGSLLLLCLVDLHNLPVMITHYPLAGVGG